MKNMEVTKIKDLYHRVKSVGRPQTIAGLYNGELSGLTCSKKERKVERGVSLEDNWELMKKNKEQIMELKNNLKSKNPKRIRGVSDPFL
jgi:hypothetical protein